MSGPAALLALALILSTAGCHPSSPSTALQAPPSRIESVAPADVEPARDPSSFRQLIVLPVQAQGESPAREASFTRDPLLPGPDDLSDREPSPEGNDQATHASEGWPREGAPFPGDEQITLVIYQPEVDETRPRVIGVSVVPATDHNTAETPPAFLAWPAATGLVESAEAISQRAALGVWKDQLSQCLARLGQVTTLAEPQALETFRALELLARQLDPLIVANSTIPVATPQQAQGPLADELRRLQDRLWVRIEIWRMAHELAASNVNSLGDVVESGLLPAPLARADVWLPTLAPRWRQHLGIDELQAAWFAEPRQTEDVQRAARRTLARLSSPILNAQQNDYLRHHVPVEIAEWLIVQSRGDSDLVALLKHVEYYLDSLDGYHAACIAQEFQNLIWQDHPKRQTLAASLERNLRQANLRISASEQFINLLVPEVPDLVEPVREQIMGAQVSGRSRIANRLQIRLLPDPDKINMRLDAVGLVRSSTQASRGGFVVDNLGTTRFQASKPLAIGRHGFLSGPPQAQADSESQVVGLRSNFDGIPFLAGLARRMAQQQIASQKQAAHHQMNQRVERSVKDRLDMEIEGQLDEIRAFFYQHIIEPLIALDLEPLAVETRTTHDRMIMQYRLAGIDQLGAASPRPGGVQSSLLSMQVHQSALNNLLSRIELSGRVFTPEELTQHLGEVFGLQFTAGEHEANIAARMEFSPYDPIGILFEDGMIAVRLNLRQFQVGRGKVWKRITVTSRYTPQIHGTQLILVQEPSGIRLSGNQFNGRDQLAIRGIFNAIFQTQYEVQLIPPSMERRLGRPMSISQFESVDGWLAISLDAVPIPITPPRQARGGLFERP